VGFLEKFDNCSIQEAPGSEEDYVTGYVKMDGQTMARIKSTGPFTAYSDEITWLHHDHLGSAVAGTDETGAVAWTEKFTPYGIALMNDAANDNQAGFTGHMKDTDTGLTYMQARYYDPVVSRFLSHDPEDFLSQELNPGFFNRYMYVENNPINMIDPTGMAGCADMGGQGLSGTCFDASNFRTQDEKGFLGLFTKKANDHSTDAVGTPSTDAAATSFAAATNQTKGNEQVSRIDTQADGTSTTSNVPLTDVGPSHAKFDPAEIAGAVGIVHTHPTKENSIIPGKGDSRVPELGIPNYIAHGTSVLAVEISGGQVRARVISGNVKDKSALRSRLRNFQSKGKNN